MPPKLIIELSATDIVVGQPFTAQALASDGSLPSGTVRFGFSDPSLISYESVAKGKVRIRPLAPGALRIDATEERRGPDATATVDITIRAAAPAPDPDPDPDPIPTPGAFRVPLVLVRMDEGTGSALFHMAPTFAPGHLPVSLLPRLRLVTEAGAPIPIAEPKETALHLDGTTARAVRLQGWHELPERDVPVRAWLEVTPEGQVPARRQEEDVSAFFLSTPETLKTAGLPPAIIWHATPEQGCASRPFDYPMVPLSQYDRLPDTIGTFAARWRSLADGKFANWTGDIHGTLQYDRGFIHIDQAIRSHDWPLLRMGCAYEAAYLQRTAPPAGAPSPQYMNSDGVGAFALLFDYEPARAFLLREAEIAYRFLARDDYALRSWTRRGGSDGDFRPLERRFKQTRWAAMLGLPQTIPLPWEEVYYQGMRGLDSAEQWILEGAGARYTHKSVGRFDATTNMGPTPDFMLGLLGTEVTVSAVETFGSRMPVALRQMADRRLDEVCAFLATQFHPSRRQLPAVRYYSDEIPGELKPWHETIPEEEKKRWPPPAVNLNDYYTLLFAAGAARLGAPAYAERALALWDGLAGDYLDGHGGPYMGKYTSVELKVFNQARLNCDRSAAYLASA